MAAALEREGRPTSPEIFLNYAQNLYFSVLMIMEGREVFASIAAGDLPAPELAPICGYDCKKQDVFLSDKNGFSVPGKWVASAGVAGLFRGSDGPTFLRTYGLTDLRTYGETDQKGKGTGRRARLLITS